MEEFVNGLYHESTQVERVWLNLVGGRQRSELTGSSLFELETGQQPMTLNTAVSGYRRNSPAVYMTVHKALLRRYEGLFPILRTVGRATYCVELLPRLNIHQVFHVTNLKPYHADPEEPSRGKSQRAPPLMVTSFVREVECIMAKHEVRSKGVPEYFE
ncbi:hypothetical protein L3X38_018500 [Prunus dulcis]|uniref:Tf2-1-like SH3-like domain-containing protein n=1 Tax=Prunus dulcis TaxID=3755 RepID=A0AAD4W9C1_PRUDU|nr:hypothetical protein L3X38_018500 [Prunus dulcis]